MNNSPLQGFYNGYHQTDERIFPIVPFLTGLIAGPLLYNAFHPYPYFGYPTPYPVPYPYGYNYGYGYGYDYGYGKGYY